MGVYAHMGVVLTDLINSINSRVPSDIKAEIAEEFNERLDSLELPTIEVSIDKDACTFGIKYHREDDLIYVYREDGTLADVLSGADVGFEVHHIYSDDEIARLMIKEGWTDKELNIDGDRQWYVLHMLTTAELQVFSLDNEHLFTIHNGSALRIPDDISHDDAISLVTEHYTDVLQLHIPSM